MNVRAVAALAALAWLLAGGASANGPERDYAASRARFLAQIAKFVEWPPDVLGHQSELTFCVSGEISVPSLLGTATPGVVAGRRLVVQPAAALDDPQACQVIFVPGPDNWAAAAAVLSRVRDLPVLTIGETPSFARTGGVIRLFADREKFAFEVNLTKADRARLRISSQVLRLGRAIREKDALAHR